MLPVVLADGKELDSPGAPVEAVAHRRAPQNRAELKEIACLGSPREVASARGRGVRCSGLIRRFLSLNLWCGGKQGGVRGGGVSCLRTNKRRRVS